MSLKLYYNFISQPSRAVYILLKNAKYKFEPKPLDLLKKSQLSAEYSAVNRFQKVPGIDHDGFALGESVAIVRYLANVGILPEQLYPRDAARQARVDEFLEWQHIGLRLHTGAYFRTKYLIPLTTQLAPNPKQVEETKAKMEVALKDLDIKWLERGQRFLAGDEPTAADILGACEVEQTRLGGYDPTEHFENVAVWLHSVRERFDPYYAEANSLLNEEVKKLEKAQS